WQVVPVSYVLAILGGTLLYWIVNIIGRAYKKDFTLYLIVLLFSLNICLYVVMQFKVEHPLIQLGILAVLFFFASHFFLKKFKTKSLRVIWMVVVVSVIFDLAA